MALDTTGITHISPSSSKFKFRQVNQFYINGTDLIGANLSDLQGTVGASSQTVNWNSVSVLDNSSATKMKVQGTPSVGGAKAKGDDDDDDDNDDFDSDSGDVTPTVSNDGSTVENTFPSDYGA